mmetsp:Transcript_24495/g.48009  ORF Transcript_24495/g.48009 Transcript_24495/m.48009 type:complete len:338 (+) Transcript_24495:933-1946(+)
MTPGQDVTNRLIVHKLNGVTVVDQTTVDLVPANDRKRVGRHHDFGVSLNHDVDGPSPLHGVTVGHTTDSVQVGKGLVEIVGGKQNLAVFVEDHSLVISLTRGIDETQFDTVNLNVLVLSAVHVGGYYLTDRLILTSAQSGADTAILEGRLLEVHTELMGGAVVGNGAHDGVELQHAGTGGLVGPDRNVFGLAILSVLQEDFGATDVIGMEVSVDDTTDRLVSDFAELTHDVSGSVVGFSDINDDDALGTLNHDGVREGVAYRAVDVFRDFDNLFFKDLGMVAEVAIGLLLASLADLGTSADLLPDIAGHKHRYGSDSTGCHSSDYGVLKKLHCSCVA